MIDGQRQTGRSTRMIQEAIKVQKMGLPIAVVGANDMQTRALKELFQQLGGSLITGTWGFYSMQTYASHVYSLPPGTITFKDHHATEQEALGASNEIKELRCQIIQARTKLNKISSVLEGSDRNIALSQPKESLPF